MGEHTYEWPEAPAGWSWDMGAPGDAPCLDCDDMEGAHIMLLSCRELGFYGFPEDFRVSTRVLEICLRAQSIFTQEEDLT